MMMVQSVHCYTDLILLSKTGCTAVSDRSFRLS